MVEEESGFQEIARYTIGVALGIEALLLFNVACVSIIFTPLMVGMSLVAGAGGASEEQVASVMRSIPYLVLAPFVVVVLLCIASWNLCRQRRPTLVKIVLGVSLVMHLITIILLHNPSAAFDIIPVIFPAAGFLLAFWMKPGTQVG